MAKRTDIKKVLIIGSGPIVIGQAAEFDYAGTQACLALKEEGYEVVLCNSNPATIMTDTSIADKVYMEPLTLEYIAKILRYERPDAIVPGIGGQTGLNLAMQLERKGVLKECGVELLGTSSRSIERAEDRELFKEMCESIGEPVIPSEITYNLEEAKKAALDIGYPVVLRPAFTLGGTGGGFANNEEELVEIGTNAFRLSPVHQVLIEKSVRGFKEIEFEVMRDSNDKAITICGMENVDPVGVHTGDSVVVAPILSLNDHDLKMLNDSAIKIIRELKVEGGCNVQFALDPNSSKYYLIDDSMAREQWQEICKSHGFDIETEPRPNVKHKDKAEYIADQMELGASLIQKSHVIIGLHLRAEIAGVDGVMVGDVGAAVVQSKELKVDEHGDELAKNKHDFYLLSCYRRRHP